MHLLRRRQAPRTDVIFGASYNQNQPVRGLRLIAIGSALTIMTASASAVALTRSVSAPHSPSVTLPTAITAEISPKTSQKTSRTSASAKGRRVQPATTARAAAVPTCSRGSYRLPASIDPSNLASGVHSQVDTPRTYAVYGNSTSAIWSQIYRCTPVVESGRFAANTGYNLSSYYAYSSNGNGTCSVTRATVTLHVNQVYPRWVNTGAPAATARSWNNFITHLRTHEAGHVSLDKAYANQLYNNLSSIKNVSCDSIAAKIRGTISTTTAALQKANDTYDHETNHGATQGAL